MSDAKSSSRLLASLTTLLVLAAGCNNGGPTEQATPSEGREPSPAEAIDVLASESVGDTTYDEDALRRLLDRDRDDGPIYVVDLVQFDADRLDASEQATLVPPSELLDELDAETVYVATVENQFVGDPQFDSVEVVRYPSRGAYLDALQEPGYQELASQRDTTIADAVTLIGEPVTPLTEEPLVAGEEPPGVPLAQHPIYPGTPDDSPWVLVATIDIADQAEYEDDLDADLTGEEALQEHYGQAMAGGDLGIRPVMWMRVEETLLGDGREWDAVRFNYWPSHATFDAVAGSADTSNRTAGLADQLTMQTLPEIDEFTPHGT